MAPRASTQLVHALGHYEHYSRLLRQVRTGDPNHAEYDRLYRLWMNRVLDEVKATPNRSVVVDNKVVAIDAIGELWITEIPTGERIHRMTRTPVLTQTHNRRADIVTGRTGKVGARPRKLAPGETDGDRGQ